MSPRGGGRIEGGGDGGDGGDGGGDSGGGGGGSSSNITDPCASAPEWCLSKGISHDSASEEYHPLGDQPNNVRLAGFGIECFCLLAVLVIVLWSSCRRKKRGGRSESSLSSSLFYAAAMTLLL
jgi:hypothetical protein